MKKNSFLKLWSVVLLAGTMFIASCGSDDEVKASRVGESGFFVVNEGAFGGGNASLSFFDRKTGEMQNDVFFTANNRPLGDQAQSMTIVGDKGYIVVQNSNKIEVINVDDYSSITTIGEQDGLESPRYLVAVSDDKAYVTDWGANGVVGTVKVLDLNTNTVTKTIPIGFGPNRMLWNGVSLYVVNGGGFNNKTFESVSDNTIAVIDPKTDEVTQKVTVGDNPKSIEEGLGGFIWVSGTGKVVYNTDFSVNLEASTPGFISKISPSNEVMFTALLPEKASGPSNMTKNADGTFLYFNYLGDVYTLDVNEEPTNSSLNIKQFIDRDKIYGFSADVATGDLIVGVAPNFTSDGSIERYDSDGKLIDTYEVGIGPNGATFK